jgi:hypothetical protein
MASFSIQANNQQSQATPVLARGRVLIVTQSSIYFRVGSDDPQANNSCAFIPAGESRELRLPTQCLKIAVLAVDQPGNVSIVEINGTKASCSA